MGFSTRKRSAGGPNHARAFREFAGIVELIDEPPSVALTGGALGTTTGLLVAGSGTLNEVGVLTTGTLSFRRVGTVFVNAFQMPAAPRLFVLPSASMTPAIAGIEGETSVIPLETPLIKVGTRPEANASVTAAGVGLVKNAAAGC
jgi:hypothetical protein